MRSYHGQQPKQTLRIDTDRTAYGSGLGYGIQSHQGWFGTPGEPVDLNRCRMHLVGIEVGATFVESVVTDLDGQQIEFQHDMPVRTAPEQTISFMQQLISDIVKRVNDRRWFGPWRGHWYSQVHSADPMPIHSLFTVPRLGRFSIRCNSQSLAKRPFDV